MLAYACGSRAAEVETARELTDEQQAAAALLAQADAEKMSRGRLDGYEQMVRTYGNSSDPRIREQVADSIGKAAYILEYDVEGAAKIDAWIALLEENGLENHVPRLLNGKASATRHNAAKLHLLSRVIEEYGDNPDTLAQNEVAKALVEMTKLHADNSTRLALLDRVLAMAGAVDSETFSKHVIKAALIRTQLLDDRAEIVRGYDAVLEQGLRRAEDFHGNLKYHLEEVLDAKAAFTGDPETKNRYYDDIVARDAGAFPTATALSAKAWDASERDKRTALFDRIIATYTDNPDTRLRKIVNLAHFGKAKLAVDKAERLRILDGLIAENWDVTVPELRYDAARALAAKASFTNDRKEMLRAYDRIIEYYATSKKNMSYVPHEIRARRDRLAGEAPDPELILDAQIANTNNDLEMLFIYEDEAYKRSDKDEKIAIYDRIVDTFQDNTNTYIRGKAAEARLRKLELLDNPDEKRQICDAIITDTIGTYSQDAYIVQRAYGIKVSLTDDVTGKIRLYDEFLARHENDPEMRCPLSETQAPSYDWDRRWEVPGTIPYGFDYRADDTTRLFIIGALHAKARLATDRDEKMALYDRIIDNYGGVTEVNAKHSVLKAVKAKAELMNDPSLAERFEDQRIHMYPDSFETVEILTKRVNAIVDADARRAACDDLLQRFAGSRDSIVASRITDLLFAQADSTADVSEKLAIYDKTIAFGVNKGNVFMGDPIDAVLRERIEMTDDTAEKILVYDRLITVLEKAMPTDRLGLLIEAILAKAKLTAEPAEKIALCDEAIARAKNYRDIYALDGQIACALRIKAEATGDNELEARYYDTIIDEDRDINKMLWAMSCRLMRAKDVKEKIRLYDKALDITKAFYPHHKCVYRILMAKAQLITDREEKKKIFEEALLYCSNEAEEIAIIKAMAALAETAPEKAAAYAMALDKLDGKKSAPASGSGQPWHNEDDPVLSLIESWIGVVDDDAEKIRLCRLILDRSRKNYDHSTRDKIMNAAKTISELTGGRTEMLAYYDQRIEDVNNDQDAANGYLDKAALADSPEAITAILDELLTRFRYSEDHQTQFCVTRAIEWKIALANDLSVMAGLYGELAAHLEERDSISFQDDAMKALLNQAELTADRNNALAIYDKVIAKYEQTGGEFYWDAHIKALAGKAELSDDITEKLRLYDAILEYSSDKRPPLYRDFRRLLQIDPTHVLPEYMLKKATLLTEHAEKSRIYDHIIEFYGISNPLAAIKAYYAKIDLAADPKSTIALYDKLIVLIGTYDGRRGLPYSHEFPKALLGKAKITGDFSPVKEYYDAAAATVTTTIGKEGLLLRKIRDTGGDGEIIAMCDQLIETYRYAGIEDELALLSLAYTTKAETLAKTDAAAASGVYDEIIRVFGMKNPPAMFDGEFFLADIIAEAYGGKARLADSPEEKIRLYDEAISMCRRYRRTPETVIERILVSKAKALWERQGERK